MPKQVQLRVNPELRELIKEASLSLARLDAERLEELALSCQALSRDVTPPDHERRTELTRQTREAAGEMAVFGRVLKATGANLDVLNRLRESRKGRPGYGSGSGVKPGCHCLGTGSSDGNH